MNGGARAIRRAGLIQSRDELEAAASGVRRVRETGGDWPRDAEGKPTRGIPLETLDAYWDEAKASSREAAAEGGTPGGAKDAAMKGAAQ